MDSLTMTKTKTESIMPLFRCARIESLGTREEGETDDRRVEIAFSSEEPVDRFFGIEILDHKTASIRLDWFRGGTAPLLLDHNRREQIGVIEKAEVGSDRVGRATVRFGKGARADEILNDVRDGIRANISVGYRIHRAVLEEVEGDEETFRITDWEPQEISFVSVPADQTVGVGRDGEDSPNSATFEIAKESTMDAPNNGTRASPNDVQNSPALTDADVTRAREEAGKAERTRISEISALATRHNMREAGDKAVADGTSIELFRGIILDKIGESAPLDNGPSDLDLSKGDQQSYSLCRALHAAASGDWSTAGFERECSQDIAERLGAPKGFYVPTDVQRGRLEMGSSAVDALRQLLAQRDLSAGVAAAGGNLVGTDHMGAAFIDILRNSMMTRRMGARMLSGLRGNVSIPKQTGAGSATWISSEGGDAGEADQTFGQLPLTPKTIGAFTEMTRQLLLQSDPSVEQLVRTDLAQVVALAIDLAGINGTGAGGQPTGILQTVGIGDVAGGTNGAAPTWADIVNIWREVAIDNADFGSTGWLVNAATVGKLAQTEKAANTARFIIDGLPGPDGMTGIAGQRAGVSNQVPSNLVKGASGAVLSALIYGNWSDLIIGEWGSLDILVDPYSKSSSGTVKVSVFQSADIGVRRAASFSAMQDAITT
jgi:HK97 family phage major capsid protein